MGNNYKYYTAIGMLLISFFFSYSAYTQETKNDTLVLINKYQREANDALLVRDFETAIISLNKAGNFISFKFNKAQQHIHARLEEQKKRTGRVRALILKGRQQGASTYTAARFFHKSIFKHGTGTFILSHQAKTTGPLFDMVKRCLKYMPEVLTPEIDTANKNQIKFDELESEYTVGTAGNEDL
ncbi:MAG: hypothetical protein IIC74_05270, partial [Bacteroidetes bacterium]|nr:hypothetical protein [Bacteroidota bacterium]